MDRTNSVELEGRIGGKDKELGSNEGRDGEDWKGQEMYTGVRHWRERRGQG